MMMRAVLVGTLAVLCSAAGATAQQGDADTRRAAERFRLFNGCKPMRLVVADVTQDAQDIDIDRDRLTVVIESRLRSARLLDGDALSHLFVEAHVLSSAFSLRVGFSKQVYDPASGITWSAETWRIGATGTHGRAGNYIVQNVSEYVDRFLVEYLRVNEEACRP